LLARGPDLVPIPATRKTARIDENIAAAELELKPAQLEILDRAFPPGVAAGMRYPEKQMANMGL